MVYIDTSALVPIFIREPKSELVLRWLESSDEGLATSEWSLVEFASAAAIKVRTGQADVDLARQAIARAYSFVQSHCTVATPGQDEFRRAAGLAGDPALKLRAGDALHLAVAEKLKAGSILCLDRVMIESAELLGIKVVTL